MSARFAPSGRPANPAGAPAARPSPAQQLFVTASMVFCVVGTLVGTGVIGTRVAESAGGDLAADATLLAPFGTAFSIWSVIYAGLAAYTVWQWLPRYAGTRRASGIGWLAGASMILNAAWLLVTQAGWIWVSVVVILALAVVLGLLVRRLGAQAAPDAPSRLIVDGTFGLYLGWVCVATCANIAAAFVGSGVSMDPAIEVALACAVLAVAAGLGVLLARRFGGRWAVALALAWGLAWIGVARLIDDPRSTAAGLAAIAAAAVVLGAAVLSGARPPATVPSRRG